MDVVGRDQPDQELTIEFDRERCVWKFKKAETELWKQPPNPPAGSNQQLSDRRQAGMGGDSNGTYAGQLAGYADTGERACPES